MACSPRLLRWIVTLTFALALYVSRAGAQVNPPPPPGTPAAKVAPGERYDAGWFRRFLLGGNYRDLWARPITVPVLDLHTFAGGLKPMEIAGGKQTKTLRLNASNGLQFVFRPVDKDGLSTPPGYDDTIVEDVLRDQVSAHHPAGALVADVLLTAAGVLHASPTLVVMPDDPRLGKFQKEYAGRLGMIEVYPSVPEPPRRSHGYRLDQIDGHEHVAVDDVVADLLLQQQRADADEAALLVEQRGAAPLRMRRCREERGVEQIFPESGELPLGENGGLERMRASAVADDVDVVVLRHRRRGTAFDHRHIEPAERQDEAEARGEIVGERVALHDRAVASREPDRRGLGDEVADREDEAVVANHDAVARAIGAEYRRGERVVRNFGAKRRPRLRAPT